MDSHSPALAARPAAPTGAAFARPLTQGEVAHLDRLREWLHGDGTDVTDPAALDARWARLLATHPPEAPAPAGVSAAIGIAVGDLLVASVADAVWRMCPGPEGATPGVLLPERPHMPVLPVLDAHARWRVRSQEWAVDYLARAAAHLRQARPALPTPHPAPDAVVAPPAPVVEEHVTHVATDERTDERTDEPDAYLPVEEVAPVAEVAPVQEAAWTPTFVEDTTEPEREPAAWTPTFVEDLAEPEPEPAAWTPTFVEDTTDALTAPLTDDPAGDDGPVVTEPGTWATPLAEPPAAPETSVAPEPSVMPWDAQPPAAVYPTPGRGMPVVPEHTLTPEDLPHRPSERVQDLALRALELALDRAVRDAAGSAPFVLVREGYDVEVLEFPHSDEGVALARAAARDGGYSAAAVAWTSPADASRPYPRVVVDASSTGRPGIRVAHSFLHDAQGGHEVGGPQVVGQSAPVL